MATDEQYLEDIRRYDPGWTIHKRFYGDIGKYLKEDGVILFQENMKASKSENFINMIAGNNLKIVDEFYVTATSAFYFIMSQKA